MTKPLTGPQTKMLRVLRDLNGNADSPRSAAPRAVAKAMWPDSVGWTKRTRKFGGRDPGAVGGTMPMKAATVLWRLEARGCASIAYDANLWSITDRGRRVLEGSDVPLPLPAKAKPAPVERSKK